MCERAGIVTVTLELYLECDAERGEALEIGEHFDVSHPMIQDAKTVSVKADFGDGDEELLKNNP